MKLRMGLRVARVGFHRSDRASRARGFESLCRNFCDLHADQRSNDGGLRAANSCRGRPTRAAKTPGLRLQTRIRKPRA